MYSLWSIAVTQLLFSLSQKPHLARNSLRKGQSQPYPKQHTQNRNRMVGNRCDGFPNFHPSNVANRYHQSYKGSKWPQWVHSLYWTFSKPIFILCLFMAVIPSALGIKRSVFSTILNAKILIFIARISFCTYLVHLMVLYQFIYTQNYDIYFTNGSIFILHFGLVLKSLFFGFMLTIII